MHVGPKEIDALAWVAARGDVGTGVEVEEFRDQADVGWLRATVQQPQGRGFHRRPRERVTYIVSPLGHVYDEQRNLLRSGPSLGMQVLVK